MPENQGASQPKSAVRSHMVWNSAMLMKTSPLRLSRKQYRMLTQQR